MREDGVRDPSQQIRELAAPAGMGRLIRRAPDHEVELDVGPTWSPATAGDPGAFQHHTSGHVGRAARRWLGGRGYRRREQHDHRESGEWGGH